MLEKTLSLIPREIPLAEITLPFEGPVACLAGIVRAFDLVRQAGKIPKIDPGDPGVPLFGRKLYNLRILPGPLAVRSGPIADAQVAVERKTRFSCDMLQAPKLAAEWDRAYSTFLARLREARVQGVVADYDGTLCDEARRYDALSKEVVTQLVRLLSAGFPLGIATGRGKSVRERLQEAIPKKLWGLVVVGYYNGGDIGLLQDNERPDGHSDVSDSLRTAKAAILEHRNFLGIGQTECRRKQITLKPIASLNRLWQCVQGLLGPIEFPGVTVLEVWAFNRHYRARGFKASSG